MPKERAELLVRSFFSEHDDRPWQVSLVSARLVVTSPSFSSDVG